MTIEFHGFSDINEELLKYAVIVTRYKKKWVFVKHKERKTWEIPGGHREQSEQILDAAKRELYEETGADKFSIIPICIYSVSKDSKQSFGGLFFADVLSFTSLPDLEIEEVGFGCKMPDNLTYPMIQPYLHEKVVTYLQNYICPATGI